MKLSFHKNIAILITLIQSTKGPLHYCQGFQKILFLQRLDNKTLQRSVSMCVNSERGGLFLIMNVVTSVCVSDDESVTTLQVT